ncbi:hypothetical protein LPN04_29675 [Rugamonas sp. A1-17]|nr:hypothetical protein [Rugamonas sp. A1-17]
MVFIFAILIALVVPAFSMFAVMFRLNEASAVRVTRNNALGLLSAVPLLVGFLQSVFVSSVWKLSDSNQAPTWFLVGGIAGLVTGMLLASNLAFVRVRFMRRDLWVMCALANLYIAGAALDHLVFFWDKAGTGVMASDLAQEADINCASEYLLVRRHGGSLNYRCPTSVVLGNPFAQPFAPWPAYESGDSVKLNQVLERLQKDTARAGASSER